MIARVTSASRALPADADDEDLLRAACRGFLEFLADEPAFARVFYIHMPAAGPQAVGRLDAAPRRFAELNRRWHERARERHPDWPAVSPQADLALGRGAPGLAPSTADAGPARGRRACDDGLLPEAHGDGPVRRSAGRRPLRGRTGTVRVPGPGAMGRADACRPAACGAGDPDRLQLRTVLGPDAHDGGEDAGAVLRRCPGRRAPGPARFPAHFAGLDAAGRRGAAVDDARLPGPQPDRPGGGAVRPAPSWSGRGSVRHRRRAGLRRPAGRDAGLRPRWVAAGRARRVDRDIRGRRGAPGRAASAPAG